MNMNMVIYLIIFDINIYRNKDISKGLYLLYLVSILLYIIL